MYELLKPALVPDAFHQHGIKLLVCPHRHYEQPKINNFYSSNCNVNPNILCNTFLTTFLLVLNSPMSEILQTRMHLTSPSLRLLHCTQNTGQDMPMLGYQLDN